MTLEKQLFKTALDDLESVKILFDSRHYNIALFQLQQSIEKLVKSYGLRSGTIKPEDLMKKISHLPYKVFTRQCSNQIEKLTKLSNTPSLIPDMIPPHQRGLDDTKEKIENIKKFQSKIYESATEDNAKITDEEIEEILEGARIFEEESFIDEEKLFMEIKEDFIKTNEHFKVYFNDPGNESIIDTINDFLENPDNQVRNRMSKQLYHMRLQEKFRYISYVWINLSLITSPHEQTARYPTESTEKTPKDLYNLDNPTIKHIPDFIELINKTIIRYKEIYTN
jgi:HEPN domain-containing protein